jgi:hypothetical protein
VNLLLSVMLFELLFCHFIFNLFGGWLFVRVSYDFDLFTGLVYFVSRLCPVLVCIISVLCFSIYLSLVIAICVVKLIFCSCCCLYFCISVKTS